MSPVFLLLFAIIFYLGLWWSFRKQIFWTMKLTTMKTYLTGKLTLIETIKFILVAIYSWLFVLIMVIFFIEDFYNISSVILRIPVYIIFFGFLVGTILKIYNLILKK